MSPRKTGPVLLFSEVCVVTQNKISSPHVYIISGGAGTSASLLVNTVLAQFPDSNLHLVPVPRVRQIGQIEEIVHRAVQNNGTLIHTLVDPRLRQKLCELAHQHELVEIDLVGCMMERFTDITQQEPLVEPGLYRRLNRAYFARVEAIEYTMNHDDGREPSKWKEADMIILGPSRAGKTPLSMYLSVMGWKVANLPLITGRPIPAELQEIDKRRIIGLMIEAGQLLIHRQQRQQNLGTSGLSAYADPNSIYEEVENAKKLYRKGAYSVVNVTDKPIEASANEIIRIITRHFPSEERQTAFLS
jgi:[pyruvate, water dikinase]-phosphate phosphotransferase / [pyruvate, water dikinase] kinase